MKLFCPSCGNALEFRYDDSFVRVCDACRSAIRRTDRGIDTLGQFADLAPARSGLQLADRGLWQGQPFELSGRAEYAHPAGGSWEEWYLHFADGRWGWLSFAEGRWALTFQSARTPEELPAFEAIEPGLQLALGGDGGALLSVAERNLGKLVSAEGEIPFVVQPGVLGRFVDLSDGKGRFATLDYGPPGSSEAPVLYLGRQVAFSALGLPLRTPQAEPLPRAAGERLACPNCGGSIELRVPGGSLAVACPYCGSVLDCEGPLAILGSVATSGSQAPIPLGAKGSFDGVEYTVTGRLRRETRASGLFYWDEYLLHHPAAGYRWLVCVNGHYSFISELPAGAVRGGRQGVDLDGQSFALFDVAEPRVTEVFGEFYWKVRVGETVRARDYIAPPAVLSSEASEGELRWSLGSYLTQAQVRQAFRMPDLPDQSSGVAANQPFRHGHWRPLALLFAAMLFVALIVNALAATNRSALEAEFDITPEQLGSGGTTPSVVLFTEPFELAGGKNVSVELSLYPLQNSWAYVAGDLIDEASGQLRTFDTELSYYSGVEGGESWSEGSRNASRILSAASGGTHVLRLEVQRPTRAFGRLLVQVREGVVVFRHWIWALLGLGLPALGFALYQYSFERARWSQSDYAPGFYASSGGDDDD